MRDWPKTFIYCQSDGRQAETSAAQQEATLRQDLTKFELESHEPVPVIETSYRKVRFHLRHMGGWLLRNVTSKDTVFVLDLSRLGALPVDTLKTLKFLHKHGVQVVISHFKGTTPITLKGHIFAFFLDLMDAIVHNSTEFRRASLAETHGKHRLGKGIYQWGCRTEFETSGKSALGKSKTKLVWDGTQLRYCADIARRLILNQEKVGDIIREYHQLGIRDHTGRPFGDRQRGLQGSGVRGIKAAFKEAAYFFMRMGVDGRLPPQWNDVAIQIDWKAKERGLAVPWNEIRTRKVNQQSP